MRAFLAGNSPHGATGFLDTCGSGFDAVHLLLGEFSKYPVVTRGVGELTSISNNACHLAQTAIYGPRRRSVAATGADQRMPL
jgi:hypothetical protein